MNPTLDPDRTTVLVPIHNGSPNVFAEPTRVSPLSSLLQHNAIKVVAAETELVLHPFCLPGNILIENASLTDPTAIEKQLALGEHVKKGQPLRLLLLSVILPPVTSYHQLGLIDTYISMWRHNINRGPNPDITQEIPAPPAFLLSGRSRSIDPTSSRKQGRTSTSAA